MQLHPGKPLWKIRVSVLVGWLVLIVCACILPEIVCADSLYVNSGTGSDSNDCKSAELACKTIGEAVTKAGSNDTINISAGTYVENIFVNSKDLIFKGQNAATTIVDGNNAASVFELSASNVTIDNLTVQNGKSDYGGGINAGNGLQVTNSRIINNHSDNAGGGVICWGGTSHFFTNTEISGNSADTYGGGVHSNSGETTFSNVTMSGNTAVSNGAGLSMNLNGTVHFESCTIVNNGSSETSAIANWDGILTFANTIVANNNNDNCGGPGPFTSLGHNLAGDSSCGFTGPGDMQNAAVMLNDLAFNDAHTMTHSLQENSPAIDAGDNTICPAKDQRGYKRPQDGDKDGTATCDIGAYELGDRGGNIIPVIMLLL